MAELINEKDSLNDGRKKLNKAIKDSDKAKTDSQQALLKAIESMDLSEQTQLELTQAILEGDSSPLGGQLSVGADSTVYDGPQERLIAEHQKVTSHLADIEQRKADKSDVKKLEDSKAETSYVDDLFTNLDGLQIKGGFDTLVDLENTYPHGTEGLYVVDDKLYGWNGNEWKKVKELEIVPWADFMTTEDEEWLI